MSEGGAEGAGLRIGAISDSHDDICDWPTVFARLREVFAGVDLILHCGDITSVSALDDLSSIAPVRATRSAADPPAGSDDRIAEGPTMIEAGGRTLVLAFGRPEPSQVDGTGAEVVVFGGTHAPGIETVDGVLWVNPGSPALAERTSVAIVTLDGEQPSAEIVDV